MIEILGNKELTKHNYIDHINNTKIDNTRENLRIVTPSENARNKLKSKNSTSKYYGVSKIKNLYQVQLSYNKQKLDAYYKIEEHAAYQWDLWIEKYNLNSNLNNIKPPMNFIEYKKNKKIDNLPLNIHKNKKLFQVFIKTYSKSFPTLEEAIEALNVYKQNIKQKLIVLPIIIRNENNECIIELFNKKKEKVGETIVDEENYFDLLKYKWYLANGYVLCNLNHTIKRLHRYVMNYTGNEVIDHINNDPLDNRKCNLRILTTAQNAMNKKSSKNGTSKYIGVSLHKKVNKWTARITLNNKNVYIGLFITEIEAAKARDLATKKHYGKYGNLNFPDD
jgi:hypothetical protein